MGLHLNQGDDDLVENHEINVTPFIDVMLVLLIIFMVAAPLGHGGYQGRPARLQRETRAPAGETGVPQRQG
jgi:biopolymer transport protein ExbD